MKLCIFIAVAACLVFYSIAGASDPQLEKLGQGEYRFYSTDIVSSPYITRTVDLGFSYIYVCDSADATKVRKLFTRIDGESITLANTDKAAVLKRLNYQTVSVSEVSSIAVTYAYSPRGKTFITDNEQKINLQIAVSGRTTTVGWPVILGSY